MAKFTKNRRAKRRAAPLGVAEVKECVICSKCIGAGGPQERTVIWKGLKSHACNACGISWRDCLSKKRKLEGREPSAGEWEEWKRSRPDYIDPQAREAANTLLLIAYSRSSRASSSSSSSPSSSSLSPARSTSSSSSNHTTPVISSTTVDSPVETDYSSELEAPYSSYTLVPPAVYKANRPAGLTVDVEGALFVTCNDIPDLDFASPASSSEYELQPITPLVSFNPHNVLRASSGRSNEGYSAYLEEGKPSAALLPNW